MSPKLNVLESLKDLGRYVEVFNKESLFLSFNARLHEVHVHAEVENAAGSIGLLSNSISVSFFSVNAKDNCYSLS